MKSSDPIATVAEARTSLAAAIQRRDAAIGRKARNQAALDRATAHMATLETALKRLDDAAQQHASQTAADLAQQLREGAFVESVQPAPVDRSVERAALQVSHNIAVQAKRELQIEFEASVTALASAHTGVRDCALKLVRLEADGIAAVIQKQEAELHELRTLLRGVGAAENLLGQVNGAQWQRPSLYTSRALAATMPAAEPQYPGSVDPAKETAIRWTKFFSDLSKDAQATLG